MSSRPAFATKTLIELGQVFQSDLELEPLLRSILITTEKAMRSQGGSIWMLDTDKIKLTCAHAIGAPAEALVGRTISAALLVEALQALQSQSAVWNAAETAHPALTALVSQLAQADTRSLAAAGLFARGELLGVLAMVNKQDEQAFTDDDRTNLQALAGYCAIAIHSARLAEEHTRSAERQRLLNQIGTYFQETLSIDVLIPRIFNEVSSAIQAQGQSIWLLDDGSTTATCKYATGLSAENVMHLTVPLDQSIVGSCIRTQQPILVADAQNDPRLYRRADARTGLVTRTLMSVPMVRQGVSIGALQAINKRDDGLFNQDDLFIFNSIASSAALAIENARLYQELRASYDLTLFALTAALDLRDRETEGHSRRVVAYTLRLARQLGLSEERIEHLRRGALLHDVGKIGVPDRILHKPGALSPEERKEIEKHPQKGYEMLLGIPPLTEAIQIVLAHHEHWDGQGYPLGLKGEAIPLGARLFAVADVYDALTSDRPYRQRRPYEVARQMIESESGKHFDPEVVAAFLAIPPEEWEQIRAEVMAEVDERHHQHQALVRKGHTALLNPSPASNASL